MQPTPTSLSLRNHAHEIAMTCPPTLYDEIALVGSSARGIASPRSDLDINIWTRTLPSHSAREAWLRAIGVQDLQYRPSNADGSEWIAGTYQQVTLEIGWQARTDVERTMQAILSGKIIDHHILKLAELFLSARHLRGGGVLANWQSQLAHYPPELADHLISDALTGWCDDEQPLNAHLHRIWRVLFALNHRWEISWKYALFYAPDLSLQPPDLIRRITQIEQLSATYAHALIYDLIADVLRLIIVTQGESSLLIHTLSQCESLRNDRS